MKKNTFALILLSCFVFVSCQNPPIPTIPKSTEPISQIETAPINEKDFFDYLPSMKLSYSYLKNVYKKYGTNYDFNHYTKQITNEGEIYKSGKNTIIVTRDSLILSVGLDNILLSSNANSNWVITTSFEKRAYEILDALLESCPDELKCQSSYLENLFKNSAKFDINGNGKYIEYEKAGVSYSLYINNKGITTITFG